MLCSFTQTYGDDRNILISAQMKDKNLVEFKNLFDVNIYSFHNCPQSVIDHFWSVNRLSNVEILTYNKMSYTDTMRVTKNVLKTLNCDVLFFIQDDGFSVDKIDYNQLLKEFKEGFISLGFCKDDFENKTLIKENSFYKTTSIDFYKQGFWALDDSPYLASFNIIDKIYNEKYLSKSNIWKAEAYLAERFTGESLDKIVLDKKLFINVNIIGPWIINNPNEGTLYGEKAKEFLKKKSLI